MYSISISWKPDRSLICLLIFAQSLYCELSKGQIQQIDRFEIPIENNESSNFAIVSAEESGLMIYRRLFESPLDKLEIIRIDTSFQQVWTKKIEIAKGLEVIKSIVNSNFMYVLFKSFNYKFGDFLIVAIDINNGAYTVHQVKNLISFYPTEFVITNEAALIGGYFNYRPLMVYFNFASQKSKILPGFFNEIGELTQVKTYPDGTTDVIVSSDNFEKQKSLWIRNYDGAGDLIKTTILEPGDKKNLIFGRSINIGNDEQAVVGVYGRYREYSRGIFIARISPIGEYKIKYYDYGELHHFFNFMKASREQRIKERIERKKIKGKKAKFNYRFIVDEVIKTNDNFIMLGEAFFPKYSYANPLSDTRVLIGYQYTHAVVIGFDKNGNLTWDNSFEINDVKSTTLDQHVKIRVVDDKIYLQYVFANEIRTKVISNNELTEGKYADEIKLKFEDDIVKDYGKNKMDYWYDGRIYIYGVQQIKNLREIQVNATRRVFFINKIIYK